MNQNPRGKGALPSCPTKYVSPEALGEGGSMPPGYPSVPRILVGDSPPDFDIVRKTTSTKVEQANDLNGTHDATNDSNQTINQPLVDEGATATLKAKRVTDGHSALIKRHAVVLPLVHPDDKYTDDLAFKDFGSAAAEKDYPDDGTISNKLPTTSRSDEGGAGSLGQKHDEIDLKEECGEYCPRVTGQTANHLPGINTSSVEESDYRDLRPAEPSYSQSEAETTDHGDSQFVPGSTPATESNDGNGEQCLSDQLFHVMVNKMHWNERFIPNGKLEAIVNVDSVESELRDCALDDLKPNGRSLRSYAEEICEGHAGCHGFEVKQGDKRSFRKIFALLVIVNKVSSIFDFLGEDICDLDLPLRTHSQSIDQYLLYRRDEEDWRRPVRFMANWNRQTRTNLYENQWGMLSPVFAVGEHGHINRYELCEHDVLPFKKRSGPAKRPLTGGQGEVIKVDIDPGHHNFYDGIFGREVRNHKSIYAVSERGFAIKTLYETDEKKWMSEIKILRQLSVANHPHLISLLAYYLQSGKVHLIFHWADADLLRYWQQVTKQPCIDIVTIRWIARQCAGLADGIRKIHGHRTNSLETNSKVGRGETLGADERNSEEALFGRHGDIKPGNILWFQRLGKDGLGRLVIADFGISEMNHKNSRSNGSNSDVMHSRTYCPPERWIPHATRTRAWDIWSLGCLYLEMLTWTLGGWDYIQEFSRARMKNERLTSLPEVKSDWFFELEASGDKITGAKVKEEVTDWIQRLHMHSACTQFIHEFLDLIQGSMLVVEGGELEARRATSIQVRTKLNKLAQRCKNSENYCTKPVPRIPCLQVMARATF